MQLTRDRTGRRGWRRVGVTAALLFVASGLEAQAGRGDGFLFREPSSTLTVHGGLAMPRARSSLFTDVTRDLTIDRMDLAAPSFGFDLAVAVSPRMDVVVGIGPISSRSTPSEFREWVDADDRPIEQVTAFYRAPMTISARYHLVDRGRTIGSFAWLPARLVPFVSGGMGLMRYRFTQDGDFIDIPEPDPTAAPEPPVVFRDELRTSGWAWVGQLGAGAHLSLSPRVMLTGEARYLLGGVDAGRSTRDFVGYRLDLSGLSTLLGLSFRL